MMEFLTSPAAWGLALLGTFLGIAVGAIPGLTGTMLIALALPFTFWMEPAHALVLLAEIELLDVLAFEQLVAVIVHDHAADFHDVATSGDLQGDVRVLLYQQYGDAELLVETLNDTEHLRHQHRRQAHGRFIHQHQLRLGHQCAADG